MQDTNPSTAQALRSLPCALGYQSFGAPWIQTSDVYVVRTQRWRRRIPVVPSAAAGIHRKRSRTLSVTTVDLARFALCVRR